MFYFIKRTKRLLVQTAFLLFSIALFAQDVDDIISSGDYIWGKGDATSMRKADRYALSHLISTISVEVESKFESVLTEVNGELTESVESCINTYSSTSLQNTQKKSWEEKGRHYVFRYMLKSDLDKVFAAREAKIKDYVKTGMEAEEEARFGDAINNYYWALLLLRSHPDNQTMAMLNKDGDSRKLITTIPALIDKLLSNLDVKLLSVQKKDDNSSFITLQANLNGVPVQNIDFIYDMGGGSWSPLQTGRDGVVVVKLFGQYAEHAEQIRVRIEYIYEHKAQIDKDVFAIVDNDDVVFPPIDNYEFKVNLYDVGRATSQALLECFQDESQKPTVAQVVDYQKTIDLLLDAIIHDKEESVKQYFTDSGWDVFNKIIGYGNAEPIDISTKLKAVKVNNETYVRALPMRFSFSNSQQSFVEKVVLVFNEDGKIDNLNFAISDISVNQLMNLDDRFGSDEDKFQLINFMELYKTSYCLKSISLIDNLFAEEALIITSKRVERDQSMLKEDLPQFRSSEEYEFVKKTKNEYLTSLKRVFASNEFVNIHFEDNEVVRANKNEKIYGIQIAQHYTSDSYADKGYLFLMVDLENIETPKIYVRSWQPDKREDGSVIGVSDFILE